MESLSLIAFVVIIFVNGLLFGFIGGYIYFLSYIEKRRIK